LVRPGVSIINGKARLIQTTSDNVFSWAIH